MAKPKLHIEGINLYDPNEVKTYPINYTDETNENIVKKGFTILKPTQIKKIPIKPKIP